MPGNDKNDGSKWQRVLARIAKCLSLVQQGLGQFLTWLSKLFKAPNILKEFFAQLCRWGAKLIPGMSPPQFACLLLGVVIIIASIAVYVGREPSLPPSGGPITVWLSEMGAGADANDYLDSDTRRAIVAIRDYLDVFDVKVRKPDQGGSDGERIVLNITVGCFRRQDDNAIAAQELRVSIPELDWDGLQEPYETLAKSFIRGIVRQLRHGILETHPPQGRIVSLEPLVEKPSESDASTERQMYVDAGRLSGVRENDVFRVVPPRKIWPIPRSQTIVIREVGATQSMATGAWDAKIEEEWGVQWIRAGD